MVAILEIIIGDATLILDRCENVLTDIGEVDALVTDPPYLINTSGGGKWRKKRSNMENITKAKIDKGFDINTFNPSLYGSFITFCHNDQLHILLPWFADNYRRHVTCNWVKDNPAPMANRNYQASTEPYVHAWNKDFHPTGILKGKINEMRRTVHAPVGKSKYDHPTVKPDVVMNKIMKNVNGETVIDPFMGTGSTGIAAIRHGKKFIGIEHNPDFFKMAVSRFYELYSSEISRPV